MNRKTSFLRPNETYTVREFIQETFKCLEISLRWEGKDADEVGYDDATGKAVIKIDKRYFRPTEVDLLIGDYNKAKTLLGWEPKVKMHELVRIMVESDLRTLSAKQGR
jgi:GDPmannose 4,6-dehydratase